MPFPLLVFLVLLGDPLVTGAFVLVHSERDSGSSLVFFSLDCRE